MKKCALFFVPFLLVSCGKDAFEQGKKAVEPPVNVVGIVNSGNPDRCSELKEEAKVKACRDNVWLENAMRDNDPAKCGNVQDAAAKIRCSNQVYLNRAAVSGNSEECAWISGSGADAARKSCRNQIVLNRAYASKKEADCEKIEGKSEDRQYCMDNVRMQVAMDKSDNSLCGKIGTEALRKQCEQFVPPKLR